MKKLLLLFSVILFSCSPGVNLYINQSIPTKQPKPENYNIEVFTNRADLNVYGDNLEAIASIWLGEGGATLVCDYNTLINIAKDNARNLGGDIILITSMKKPNLQTSCYTVTADIFSIKPSTKTDWGRNPRIPQKSSNKIFYWTQKQRQSVIDECLDLKQVSEEYCECMLACIEQLQISYDMYNQLNKEHYLYTPEENKIADSFVECIKSNCY